jgi:hypothetical protein
VPAGLRDEAHGNAGRRGGAACEACGCD